MFHHRLPLWYASTRRDANRAELLCASLQCFYTYLQYVTVNTHIWYTPIFFKSRIRLVPNACTWYICMCKHLELQMLKALHYYIYTNNALQFLLINQRSSHASTVFRRIACALCYRLFAANDNRKQKQQLYCIVFIYK